MENMLITTPSSATFEGPPIIVKTSAEKSPSVLPCDSSGCVAVHASDATIIPRSGLFNKIADHLFSGIIATSATAITYKTWLASESTRLLCQEINAIGFNAFEQYLPGTKNALVNSCMGVLQVYSPITKLCSHLNSTSVFEQLMPQTVKNSLLSQCDQLNDYSDATQNFCNKIQSVGLNIFEQMGSMEPKQFLLDSCSHLNLNRPLFLLPMIVTSCVAAYYTLRFFSPSLPNESKRQIIPASS